MERFKTWLRNDWEETKLLFRSIPALPFALLCAALIAMNYLANKGLITDETASNFISLDAGIIVSWIAFLAGDMLVKRFGAKAAIKVNLAAIGIQIVAVILLTIGAAIPGSVDFGVGFQYGLDGAVDNTAFSSIFMAGFWPMLGGTLAFCLATVVDSVLSKFLLTRFKDRTSFKAYAVASYASTALGQFLDNLFFALFFGMWQGWFAHGGNEVGYVISNLLCISGVGMVVELIGQAILSPVGYKMCQSWAKKGVGQLYIDKVQEAQEVNEKNATVEKLKVSPAKVIFFILAGLSILGSIVLALVTRLTLCENPEPYVLNLTTTASWMIAVVYVLAFTAFVFYLLGAFWKGKEKK